MREGISLPDNWAPMPSHEKVSLVTLNTNSIEYQDVVRQFQATVPNVNVKKIERVQNPELYRTFKVKQWTKAVPRNWWEKYRRDQ